MRFRVDRGTMRGAKRVIVTKDLILIDHGLAKQHGIVGDHFQSKAEALRYIALQQLQRAGLVRNLRRQVRFTLDVQRPDRMIVKVGVYIADHVYEERLRITDDWREVIEDVKPSGGHREDLYLWKKRHFALQYGKEIREWTGNSRRF